MSLKLGNNDVAKVMLGDQTVSAVYKGTDEVWSLGGSGGPTVNVSEVFSTYLYMGTAAFHEIKNGIDLANEGGMVWIKSRDSTDFHVLFDTERGVEQHLYPCENWKEWSGGDQGVDEWLEDGFKLGGGAGSNNQGGHSYVSWTFRKSPGFMDIVKYEGDGNSEQVIPHDLGANAGIVMVKRLDANQSWGVWHKDAIMEHNGAIRSLHGMLDQINSFDNYGYFPILAEDVETNFTDEHFTVSGSNAGNVSGGKYVAYVFADGDMDGSVIKCGAFDVKNYVDFVVELGWEPQFLMVKDATTTGNWYLVDTVRGWQKGNTTKTLDADTATNEGAENKGYPAGNGFHTDGGFAAYGDKHVFIAIKANPNFRMPPEWEQMNEKVTKKIARQEAVKEAAIEKVKNSKDIKDDD